MNGPRFPHPFLYGAVSTAAIIWSYAAASFNSFVGGNAADAYLALFGFLLMLPLATAGNYLVARMLAKRKYGNTEGFGMYGVGSIVSLVSTFVLMVVVIVLAIVASLASCIGVC